MEWHKEMKDEKERSIFISHPFGHNGLFRFSIIQDVPKQRYECNIRCRSLLDDQGLPDPRTQFKHVLDEWILPLETPIDEVKQKAMIRGSWFFQKPGAQCYREMAGAGVEA
jgi:hypothetical protein